MVERNDPSFYCERPNCSLPRKIGTLGALVLLFVVVQQYTALSRVIQKEDHRDKSGNHDLVWSPPRVLIGQSNGGPKNNHRENNTIRFGLADTKKMNASSPSWTGNGHPMGSKYDVATIRRQSPRNKNRKDMKQCKVPPGLGAEGTEGFQGLIKIQIYNASATHPSAGVVPPKVPPTVQKSVLCIVLTDSTRHAKILQAIVDTYAPRCDGFLAASNQSDPSLGAVDLFSGLQKTHPSHQYWEWEKIRQVWHYMYDNYRNDYDFFHLGSDDMFVIPENLRYFLSTYHYDETSTNLREEDENSSAEDTPHTNVVEQFITTNNDAITTTTTTTATEDLPLYLGGAVVASRVFPDRRHCGGGAGYSLNRAALTLFQTQLSNHNCQNATFLLQQRPQLWDTHTTGIDSIKATVPVSVDRLMAECFAVSNIYCAKTTDSQFAVRYLEFGIDYQARWSKLLKGPIKYNPLRVHHGIYMGAGVHGISTSAVSIHLVNGLEPLGSPLAKAIRRLDMVLNRRCQDQWDKRLGALDATGKPGYVHDATYIRKNPPPFRYDKLKSDNFGVCEVSLGKGLEEEMGLVALQKIRIMNNVAVVGAKLPRVMCLIYTHSNRHDRVRAIAETFAPRCDGFMAASNLTDISIGAVNLLHEGPELYENMWLKVRSIWQYVYDNYLNDYDFFQVGGDDHYVIPENLRYVSATGSWKGLWNQSAPLYLGGAMLNFPHTASRYCGGGAGYTLNRVALKLLIEDAFDSHQCKPHYRASDEDRIIANCFRPFGIQCMDTNDHLNETRYHAGRADFHATWNHSLPAPWRYEPLEKVHGIANNEYLGQISETSVSFHLKGPRKGFEDRGIRRYHAILYGLCNRTTLKT